MRKKIDIDKMELTFLIPPAGINAMEMGVDRSFAPGRYVCTDPDIARFLYRYPGTELIGARPLPPPGPIADSDPRIFDQCPEPTRVYNDTFSGGGVSQCPQKPKATFSKR